MTAGDFDRNEYRIGVDVGYLPTDLVPVFLYRVEQDPDLDGHRREFVAGGVTLLAPPPAELAASPTGQITAIVDGLVSASRRIQSHAEETVLEWRLDGLLDLGLLEP